MNNIVQRERLLEILLEILKYGDDLSISDLDKVETLAEMCADQIPDRFFDIIEKFHEEGGNLELVFERLYKIMSISMEFPSESGQPIDEALLPMFSLDGTDSERVMQLCSGMRKIVFISDDFDAPHKRRLLNRIAAIEHQVNQEKGLFDVALGGLNDLGEAFGKFGKDIKPLSDRMREVVEVLRRNTPEYNQLPSPEEMQRLPPPDNGGQE